MSRSTSITLRLARPADFTALSAVLHDTYESTWLPAMTEAAIEAFRTQDRSVAYIKARGDRFWIAEHQGEAVGFVDWEGDFVNAIHVRSSHARLGVGTLLMNEAEAKIAAAGYSAVRLETDTFNSRSQMFYAARGYREADRYPDEEWASGFTTLLLVKTLP